MNIAEMGTVLAIVVICYLIGMAAKASNRCPDNVIPVVVGVAGGILGVVGMYCLLHNKNTKSCKAKMENVASPFWRMLQLHQNRLLELALVRL